MKLKVQGMEVIGFSGYIFFLLFDLFLQYLIPFVRSFYSWLVVGGLRLVLEVVYIVREDVRNLILGYTSLTNKFF